MRKISCCMTTFNRIANPGGCVHEAVESFLRQDHPDRELVISNDCPQQQLVFDHPLVHIINQPVRASCFAEAVNRAVAASSGELVVMFDDDDIHLPWSLSLRARLLAESMQECIGVYGFFYAESNRIVKLTRAMHGSQGWMLTRRLWDEMGGYRVPCQQQADTDLVARLGARLLRFTVPDEQVYLIYRWGDGNYHLSGQAPLWDGDPAQWLAVGQLPVIGGRQEIDPHWRQDYTALCRAFC